MTKTTVLDIETIALPEAEIRAKLPPFDPAKVKLGNAKKPELVAEIIAEAQKTHGDDEVARGALDPATGTIAIAGFLDCDKGIVSQFMGDEADILAKTFDNILSIFTDGGIVTGWNVRGFDLPFLVKRAWLLGVKVPLRIYNPFKPRYPWSESILDLMDVWSTGDHTRARTSLATALRELGLPPKSGNGADFGAMWAADRKGALEYNADDLRCEAAVAARVL